MNSPFQAGTARWPQRPEADSSAPSRGSSGFGSLAASFVGIESAEHDLAALHVRMVALEDMLQALLSETVDLLREAAGEEAVGNLKP